MSRTSLLPFKFCINQYRPYSSFPLHSRDSDEQSTIPLRNLDSDSILSRRQRKSISKREFETLERLICLTEENQIGELMETLQYDPELTNPVIFERIMRIKFQIDWDKEIALKERMFDIMLLRDIKPSVMTFVPLVGLYGMRGELDKADDLYFKMINEFDLKPESYILTTMMRWNGSHIEKMEKYLSFFKEEGVKPTVVTYNVLIHAYLKSEMYKKALETFDTLVRAGIAPELETYTMLINIYSKFYGLEKAEELFNSLSGLGFERNAVTYYTMINVYSHHGVLDKAVQLYEWIECDDVHHNGLRGDRLHVIYDAMIDAYLRRDMLDEALEVLASQKANGFIPRKSTFGIFIDYFSKCGKHLDKYMLVLKEMHEAIYDPLVPDWNGIMQAFSIAEGEEDQVKALSIWKCLSLEREHWTMGMVMPQMDFRRFPNARTVAIALDICRKGRFEQDAFDIWMYGQEKSDPNLHVKSGGIMFDNGILASYVECLATFGEKGADRAVELIMQGVQEEKMPLRSVRPVKNTMERAVLALKSNGWIEHAAKIENIVV
jgi:pentatricopeptide repeat protein